MAGFHSKLSAFELKAIARVDQVRRASIIELFSIIIDATPFDEGFLRGGWQTSLNTPSTQVLSRKDPTGAIAKGQILHNLGEVASVVWFTNTMPYAYRIEYDAWSAQARGGMVRPNLVKWPAIVAAKAKEFSD